MPADQPRDYRGLMDRLSAESQASPIAADTRTERMKTVVDWAWDRFSTQGVSWIGFYGRAAGNDGMILLERRDKPACSPIGLHGACGQALVRGKSLVVTDVAKLGEGYIACDPKDRSELVVPMFDPDGSCWGVLDVDSFDLAAFDRVDAEGFWSVCFAAGLTTGVQPGVETI